MRKFFIVVSFIGVFPLLAFAQNEQTFSVNDYETVVAKISNHVSTALVCIQNGPSARFTLDGFELALKKDKRVTNNCGRAGKSSAFEKDGMLCGYFDSPYNPKNQAVCF